MGPQLRWAIPTSRLLGWSWLHLGLFQTGTQGCWCFSYNQTQQISHNDEDTQIWQNWVTACNSHGSNMKGSPNDKHKAEGSCIVTSSASRPQPIKRPSFFLRKNDLYCSDWAIFQTGSPNRSRFGAWVVARPLRAQLEERIFRFEFHPKMAKVYQLCFKKSKNIQKINPRGSNNSTFPLINSTNDG